MPAAKRRRVQPLDSPRTSETSTLVDSDVHAAHFTKQHAASLATISLSAGGAKTDEFQPRRPTTTTERGRHQGEGSPANHKVDHNAICGQGTAVSADAVKGKVERQGDGDAEKAVGHDSESFEPKVEEDGTIVVSWYGERDPANPLK